MRDPNKRMRIPPGIGRRDSPRPQVAVDLRARLGYFVGNRLRTGHLQIETGLPSLYAQQDAIHAPRGLLLRGIEARSRKGVAGPAVATQDAALLLAQSQVRELVAANRRKDEFLALLAHELRSPLCAIGYAAGLLRKDTTEEGRQQSLQALIERQVVRMNHLVDEVLDVSRVTNGLLHLHSERVDLRVVIANATETLQSDIERRNQRLNTLVPEVPVWVMGDERRLEQVFVNLIANASRYTDEGGNLTTRMYTEGGEVVIRIRDSGIGIAPLALPGIFELFSQANRADPRSRAGLGVGLALVRQLVELHGGNVTAASEGIGRGSEFTINLPIVGDWLPVTSETRAGEVSSRQVG